MIPHLALTRRHFLALGASLLAPAAARAQSTPVAPEAAPPARMQVSAFLPELPSVTADAWFGQFILAPGNDIPALDRNGAALILVRSGGVSLASDLPVVHRRADETGPATPVDVPPDGLLLASGDGAFILDATRMTISGADGELADILVLVVHSRINDDTSADAWSPSEPTQLLGIAPLTFHTGGAVMIVEQDVVRPGASDYSATFRGTELGAIASGKARVIDQRGMSWRTAGGPDARDLRVPGAEPVERGISMHLETGDTYATVDGSLTWRAGASEPLVVLRAQVIPIPQPISSTGAGWVG